ncbi:hypothetical protein TRFO_30253 [Tritrichomonas foetus]|uniref:Uncharacterized protein n=1 Tax=Tritrichomonas foetus TaxID=1144522 RepID=A0A1J4JTY1_9EUKA|nr:hypothetical protein TRFO_30253 [Tritrichomonas foetus]|eukprot:OHT02585.1 hypothetical protein TRFO_30253 [Tritrichomonas foetus]
MKENKHVQLYCFVYLRQFVSLLFLCRMFKGPRLKSAPFAPFSRSFLPDPILRKAGFVKSNDCPYVRNTATKTTHNEYFKTTLDSMFGTPSPKILRLDTLFENITIGNSEKGRGSILPFAEIKSIKVDPNSPSHVIVYPADRRTVSFTMETADIAKEFLQKIETILQAKKATET